MFMDIPVQQDLLLNSEGQVQGGEISQAMMGCRFDPGYLRPYIDRNGQKCVTINAGQKWDKEKAAYIPLSKVVKVKDLIANGVSTPVLNATLALRKDEWIQMDQVVLRAARQRLRAWSDLAAANSFGGFNGMSKMILEHETMSDPGEALVDMDGLTEGTTDAPKFQLEGLPLPITHSSFWFSSRRLAISRNGGTPLDTSMGEAAGRRVAETIEQTLIGTKTGVTYGTTADYGNTPTVYGYTNHPDRAVKTDLTAPTVSNGTTIVNDVLAMRELAYGQNFFGPFMLYISTGYDTFLDNDFKADSDKTVRQRISEIDGINGVRRLDYLTGNAMILVQMTADVARAINGMDIRTVQWEGQGGMQLNFKVMAIQVPQIRSDFGGNCGIVHGTAP